MLGFRKKEQAAAVSVQTRPEESFRLGRAAPPGPGERALYRALRAHHRRLHQQAAPAAGQLCGGVPR